MRKSGQRVAPILKQTEMKKRNLLKNTLIAAAILFSLTGCAQEKVLPAADFPVEITSFVTKYFPDNAVLQVIEDRDGMIRTYDVLLAEGISLEFNRKREIIDINGNAKLPDGVIPPVILQYVTANFPDNVITSWELDDRKQKVELNNGLDLEFNLKGEFLRLDK
jgi:hypothetical protein